MRKAYKMLVGKPDGKRPIRRPRHSVSKLEWLLEKQDGKV